MAGFGKAVGRSRAIGPRRGLRLGPKPERGGAPDALPREPAARIPPPPLRRGLPRAPLRAADLRGENPRVPPRNAAECQSQAASAAPADVFQRTARKPTMTRFYLTTAIDYVNSVPHLGTAYEKIGADALARFQRLAGREVHFQMGNDEHSTNVLKAAREKGMDPKAYCDEMRGKFTEIWKKLGISYDDFIQTSEPRHHKATQKLFDAILKTGDIYEDLYEGWYCESCEAFYTEKDLVEGLCPHHKTKPKWLSEKNFFFKLSKYQQPLLDHIAAHPEFIVPEIRRNEIVSLIKGGLQNVSVSRSGFEWGIPLPNDAGHVVYVWFDALINYLTAVGYADDPARFEKWWPADLHVIGKDITRFHCVIWPAMLMSAGLPLPKTVFGHGFVYLKGEKMSKSLGNVVTPLDVADVYGPDALRYYLLRGSSFGADGNFTWEDFIKRYNADLANDLGNVLNRSMGMAKKYFNGLLKPGEAAEADKPLILKAGETGKKVRQAMDYLQGDIQCHLALEAIWDLIGAVDKYIDSSAPWTLKKEGKEARLAQVLYNVFNCLRLIGMWVAPFMPFTGEKIYAQLRLPFPKTFAEGAPWTAMPAEHQLGEAAPLFPRIETEAK
ncbi:methionine--tRNA ligase [Deltaproteobacteria bacterium PRO3]|nr:methionine--tRNA ligase [Deltaproteobacteria bacterium PRO3]